MGILDKNVMCGAILFSIALIQIGYGLAAGETNNIESDKSDQIEDTDSYRHCYKAAEEESRGGETFDKHSAAELRQKCVQMPNLLSCIQNSTNAMAENQTEVQQTNYKLLVNTFTAIGGFLCKDDGNQLIAFSNDGGYECYEEKQLQFYGCLYQADDSLSRFPDVAIGTRECSALPTIKQCITSILQTCEGKQLPTIFQEMMDAVQGVWPCREQTSAKQQSLLLRLG